MASQPLFPPTKCPSSFPQQNQVLQSLVEPIHFQSAPGHMPPTLLYSLYSNDHRQFILHVFNRYGVNINQIPGPLLDPG